MNTSPPLQGYLGFLYVHFLALHEINDLFDPFLHTSTTSTFVGIKKLSFSFLGTHLFHLNMSWVT